MPNVDFYCGKLIGIMRQQICGANEFGMLCTKSRDKIVL